MIQWRPPVACARWMVAACCMAAATSCLPALDRLDEATLYEGPRFTLKVVRYHASMFLSEEGVVGFVSCSSDATRDRPAGPANDRGWMTLRAVPARTSTRADELTPAAMEKLVVVSDSVLVVTEAVLSVSFDGCGTLRTWDARELPDTFLLPPELPAFCAQRGEADFCSYLAKNIEVNYSGISADTRGGVSFLVESSRFPRGTGIRVESADSGRTWRETRVVVSPAPMVVP